MSAGRNLDIFQRNLLPPSSAYKNTPRPKKGERKKRGGGCLRKRKDYQMLWPSQHETRSSIVKQGMSIGRISTSDTVKNWKKTEPKVNAKKGI